jgi:hypothetical protein
MEKFALNYVKSTVGNYDYEISDISLWIPIAKPSLETEIVIYGISGLFKILPTRGICNLRGLARVGYYLEWVVLNNPRMPYNVLSNIPQFLDNDIIDEILLPMGYER